MNERLEWFINNYTPLIRMSNGSDHSIPSIYIPTDSDQFPNQLTELFVALEVYTRDINIFSTSDNISNFITAHSFTGDPNFFIFLIMKLYGELISLNQSHTTSEHDCTNLNDIIIAALAIAQTIPDSYVTTTNLIIELMLHVKALYTVITHKFKPSDLNSMFDHDLLKVLFELIDKHINLDNSQPHDLTHINSPYSFELSHITIFSIIQPKNLL